MKASAKSFPYPVLGNEDDVNSVFNLRLNYSLDPDWIVINFNIDLPSSYYKKLIDDGNAVIILQVECSSTFYRKIFKFNNFKDGVLIPANDLRGRVELSFFMCAKKNNCNYHPPEAHKDYEDYGPFTIEKGDIIAIGPKGTFIADKEFDPLNAPMESIMRIQSADFSGPTRINYEDDKITITLASDDYKLYKNFVRTSPSLLHASIVLPALIDALHILNDEEYAGYRWNERLGQICKEKKLEPDYAFETAQSILGLPIRRNFEDVLRYINDIEENEGDG